jgi:hypothetical protein
MTISGFSGPECREARQLLGVYVVGAIDPADRAIVDDHLGECAACRDELAGLAGLPAMLSRVPEADVERLISGITDLPERADPPPELLNSLLRKVSARRRTRMWRGAVAVAASAVLAAGAATAVSQLTDSHNAQPAGTHVASAMNPVTHVAAVVDYTQTPWHSTDMRVQVSGIAPGTTCQFWVLGSHGSRTQAGYWTIGTGYAAADHWYTAAAPVQPGSVGHFEITNSTGKVLVNIPASPRAG